MAHFLANLSILWLVVFVWGILGMGIILFLTPKKLYTCEGLLAPLLGMVLMGAVGLYRIGFFIKPLHPWMDIILLGSVSFLLMWFNRKNQGFPRFFFQYRTLFIVPILYSLVFSTLFHKTGFELLSGSEDELQYCANATHMLMHQHRGTEQDIPVARVDHWVYDFSTRDLPYMKTYRRGAEIVLSSVMKFSGLTAEESFPLLLGAGQIVFLLVCGFIGASGLGLSLRNTVGLQFCLMITFHFLFHQITGSLANLLSVSMYLATLTGLGMAMAEASLPRFILTGLFASGCLVFYSEICSISLFAPLGGLVVWKGIRRKLTRREVTGLVIFFLVVLSVAFPTYNAVYRNTLSNFEVMNKGVAQKAQHQGAGKIHRHLRHFINPEQWIKVLPYMGVYSYYNNTSMEGEIVSFTSRYPRWVTAFIFSVYFFAGLGFSRYQAVPRKRKHFEVVLLLGMAFWIYLAIVGASLFSDDALRAARSSGYLMPYLILGLFLFFSSSSREVPLKWVSFYLGSFFFFLLLAMNLGSTARTFSFILRHDFLNDPIIRRLNPSNPEWVKLRQELESISSTRPFMISGFEGSTRAHWLANGTNPLPHFLGDSISSNWRIFDLTVSGSESYAPGDLSERTQGDLHWLYASRLSDLELARARKRPNWNYFFPKFLEESRQALVPPGHPFPVEWEKWMDIYPFRRTHYPNMTDVLYKNEFAIEIEEEKIGPLEKDEQGLYRRLSQSAKLYPRDLRGSCFELRIRFEGEKDSLQVLGAQAGRPQRPSQGGESEMVTEVNYSQALGLRVRPRTSPVKIRSLQWQPRQACTSF